MLSLCDELGNVILDNNGRMITLGFKVMIDSDGNMYAEDGSGHMQNFGITLGFFTFPHPDKLEKIGDNLYRVTEESGNPINYSTNPDFSDYIGGLEFEIKIERK